MIDITHLHKKTTLKAFTLVEMLIVVVIIGILAAALIPQLIGNQAIARDTARVAKIGQIQTALEIASSNQGLYPNMADKCADDKLQAELRANLNNMPVDPQKGRIAK